MGAVWHPCRHSVGQGACPALRCSGCTSKGHPVRHEPPRPLYCCVVVRGLKEGNAPCETACLHLFFYPPSVGSPTAACPSKPIQPRVPAGLGSVPSAGMVVLSPGSACPHWSRAAAPTSQVLAAPQPGHPPPSPWAAKKQCLYPCHCLPACAVLSPFPQCPALEALTAVPGSSCGVV